MSAHPPAVTAGTVTRWLRARALLWTALVVLLLAALSLLVALTFHYRSSRMQAAVEANAATAADQLVQLLERNLQAILALPGRATPSETWQHHAQELLLAHPEVLRLERRSADHRVLDAVDTRSRPPLFSELNRSEAQLDTELACSTAHRRHGPTYSRSYFVPHSDGLGSEVMDLCIEEPLGDQPDRLRGRDLFARRPAGPALGRRRRARPRALLRRRRRHAARARPACTAAPACTAPSRMVDLPGSRLQLRLDSASARPSLMPEPGHGAGARSLAGAVRRGRAAGARRAQARPRRGARWPRRWRSARRWRTRSSPACARATCTAASPTSTRRSARWSASAPSELIGRGHAALLAARARSRTTSARQQVRGWPGTPAAAARRLRDRLHAQERRALPGADLRGAADRRRTAARPAG